MKHAPGWQNAGRWDGTVGCCWRRLFQPASAKRLNRRRYASAIGWVGLAAVADVLGTDVHRDAADIARGVVKQALLGIWLGERPADWKLKEALLGQVGL